MGPRLRLPRYVHGFIDRHGKPRFYFRRAGFGSRPLRGSLYSSQFMDDYEAALAGQSLPIGADRARPGTMAVLALSYFASPQFRGMRSSSQKIYRGIIERFCREHGDKRAALLEREHIVRLMAGYADRPNVANALRRVLRAMMQRTSGGNNPTISMQIGASVPIVSQTEIDPMKTALSLMLALATDDGARRGAARAEAAGAGRLVPARLYSLRGGFEIRCQAF